MPLTIVEVALEYAHLSKIEVSGRQHSPVVQRPANLHGLGSEAGDVVRAPREPALVAEVGVDDSESLPIPQFLCEALCL